MIRNLPRNPTRALRWTIVGLFLFSAPLLATSKPSVSVELFSGGNTVFLEDTVRFQVRVNSDGLELWGFEFYLTVDPAIFEPILQEEIHDTTIIYRPFIPTTQLIKDNATPEINDTHGDVWSDPYPDPDQNGIPGFQMDFSHQAGVTPRKTFIGSGTAAYFDMVVRQFPDNPSRTTTITMDHKYPYQYIRHRECRYDGPTTGGYKSFPIRNNLTVTVLGLAIHPEIPDTVMTPGTDFRISLWDHFVPGLYDSSGVSWSISPNAPLPTGADTLLVDLEPPPSFRDSLIVTTTPTTHGVIDLDVILHPNDGLAPDYIDRWVAIVDYPPVIGPSVPGTINFDEDDSTGIVASDLFTDPDDTPAEMTLWLDPDGPIHVNYDTGVDAVYFSADTNWYGTRDVRLYIQDMPGLSIDTLITVTVNAVNDTPVVNLDSVSALGDTLIIHRATPDTLDLSLFVSDVDDAVLSWSVNNPDTVNLPTAAIWSGYRLRLMAADNANYVDIDLILTATDAFGASASDTLVVSIRSWPPVITILDDIKILAGVDSTVALDDWVSDNDTPDSDMTWSFQVVDTAGAPDLAVMTTYNQPSQTVTLSTPTGHAAMDSLIMTVEDDDNNITTDTARLFIFDDDGPMIYPLPGLTVYRNTTYAGIIDLDDYVVDLQDDPADINWSYTGGDSLASFDINSLNNEVTIITNPTFIGNLTVSLVAENSLGLTDTSDLAILVSRLVDGPPLWYAVPEEVEVVYGWTTDLFNYSQVCYDETPTDQIVFTPYYEEDSLTVTVVSPDSVKLETPISDKKYTTRLYFSARDEIDSVSNSGIITVHVKDSFSPVWQRIPTISLNVGGTSSGLFLKDYVSDRDTPDDLLTIEVENLNPSLITMSYNSATTELTVQAGLDKGDRWLSLSATDNKGNTALTLAHVVVFSVADYTPPVGGLTYFFNPIADRWIHYVLVADSTTIWFNTTYKFNSQEMKLEFTQRDSLPGTLTWFAPFHFEYPGTYDLSADLADDAYPANNLHLALSLGASFSKAMGDVLASPDRRLTVSYPAAPIPVGKLLIIAEDSMPELAGAPRGGYAQGPGTAEITRTGANKGNDTPVPATLYSLDTNLPEPILVTLTYHQNRDADPYYSFYEVDGDQLRKIETYTGADGQFEAAVTFGRDVIFARSDTPARRAPLPDEELSCYPNPFNSTIQVRFLLRREDRGRIVIYNLLGREVYASPRQPFGLGVHAFSWHGIDNRGLLVPSGAYFIRLETDGGKLVTRKVTLLK